MVDFNGSKHISYNFNELTGIDGHGKYNISLRNYNVSNIPQFELTIPLYIYIVTSVLNLFIFCVGTFGNVLVIIAVTTVREMRTPTNVFLLNLSVSDVLVLLICQPAGLLEFFGKDRWYLGKFMCKLVPLMENSVIHVSILTMLAVTFERYNALCHPFKQRMATTISVTIKTILCLWVVGTFSTLPFLLMTELQDATFYDGTPVKVCRTLVNSSLGYTYVLAVVLMFFIVPFFTLIGFYTRIIKQLMSDKLRTLAQNERSAVNMMRSRKQVIHMLIFIIILFFLSLFPIRVFTLWLVFVPPRDKANLGLEGYLNLVSWARVLMYVNSVGNPIIYRLTSTKFQAAFRRILCRRRVLRYNRYTSTRISSRRNAKSVAKFGNTPLTLVNNTKSPSIRFKRSFKSNTASTRSSSSRNFSPNDFD